MFLRLSFMAIENEKNKKCCEEKEEESVLEIFGKQVNLEKEYNYYSY